MRFKFIEEHRSVFSIGRMCRVMNVSPRGLRAFRNRPASRENAGGILHHVSGEIGLSQMG